MCSVEGFTGKHDFSIEEYSKYNENRGPDGTTYYKDNYINLGHSLLAISPNKTPVRQPWKMNDDRILVWNGEIFGLDDDTFDTEWLANRIEKKSIAGLKRSVNWMGAGVVYDIKNLQIMMFRDHWGVKPLYYLDFEGNLFFSSTPRPLYAVLQNKGKEICKDQKEWKVFQNNDRHMFGTRVPVPRIRRLSPGQIRTYDIRQQKFIHDDTFWGCDDRDWTLHHDLTFHPKDLEKMFKKTFKQVCHAPGIPKTISLSGGLDSTLIASIARHEDDIDVQSMKYEDVDKDLDTTNKNMFGEYALAKKTAKQYKLPFNTTDYPIDNEHLITEGQFALSIPQWDRNRWTTRYANIQAAAERGRKIYIVGDGADELLTGYNGDYDYFSRQKSRPALTEQVMRGYAKTDIKWQELYRITPHWLFGDDMINNRLFVRLIQHVDSFCTTVDHICGHFGMESRMPFLSQELSKYLMKIPSTYKLHVPFELEGEERNMMMGHYKWLIRDCMAKHLPKHIKERQSKIGFATPWDARNNEQNKKLANEDWKIFESQAIKYFNFDYVDFNNKLEDNDIKLGES